MTATVCVDDRLGMMFNHRRQSQDRVLREELFRLADGRPLLVTPYTARQFQPEDQEKLQISDSPAAAAGEEDICFLEEGPLAPWASSISRLVLFRWNRHYPADVWLDIPLSDFTLEETREFPGFSHEKITMEVYRK